MNLDVFCVEHGRWVHNSGTDNGFNATYGVAATSVRKKAEVEKDQSGVWQEVEIVNAKNNTKTTTGTYTALARSGEYNEKVYRYVAYFKARLSAERNVIGFIAVSGNKVIGCDMFATAILFNQQIGRAHV